MADSPAQLIDEVIAAARRAGRADLEQRLRQGLARAQRRETVVVVAGEFKQGKSSLVNALLETDVCPVDDDLATAVPTVVRYGSEPSVSVHLGGGDRAEVETVQPTELAQWVTEVGNPDNVRGVERVEITLPHPLLEQGLVLVDTPGVGGLSAGHAAATAAYLPYADALVFVSDASTELTAPELELLAAASPRCPEVSVALAKVDLYPAWARIADLDRGHLADAGLDVEVRPVSTAALGIALATGDGALADESGVPALRRHLREDVLDPSRAGAARALVADGQAVVEHLWAIAEGQRTAAADPTAAADAQERCQELASRLAELRQGGARWQQVLSDGTADLSGRLSFRFRSEMRQLGRDLDEEVEQLRTPEQWDSLAATLQRRAAEVVGAVFVELDHEVAELAERIRALLHDDVELAVAATGTDDEVVADLVAAELALPEARKGIRAAAGSSMTALRGAQSGLLLFGLLGRYLPVGAAALLMSNPVTLVLGAAFAGKQVVNVRRQNLTARRQQARTAVRSFLDDLQFEASNRLAEELRTRTRMLRDEVTARVGELQATVQGLAEAARAEADAVEAERARLVAEAEATADAVASLRPRLADLADRLGLGEP